MSRRLAMAAWCVTTFGLSVLTASADDGSLFRDQVAPLLVQNCISCHGPSQPKGKLSLVAAESTLAGGESGAAVKPGKPDESLLIQYISGDRPEMPKDKPPLGKEQVALICRWVAEGAVWPKGLILKDNRRADASWWSLQPLSKAEPPSPQGIPDAWAKHPIDRFIYDELAKHQLKPSPEADRRTLIRRLTFDLTGLPPTPEEVDAFLLDRSRDAYEKLVDRLLASPRYGERWGRHWLDVIRFGESNGYERNHLHDNAWPFRDYIIRSFNDDKPYDRLVIEHLAGDQLEPGNPDVEVGTGFIVAGSYDNVGNSDPVAAAQIHANMLDDTIAATSTAFLGLTINCARCHDHKFDPVPQADYYRLQCAFAGVNQGTRPLVTAEQRKKFAVDRKQFDEEQKNKAADEKGKKKPRQPIGQPRLPEAWIGHFHQPGEPTYLMKGGDPQKHGETIAPASLSVLEKVVPTYTLPVNAPEGQRRLALARWMVDRTNPLTPRVLVNRLWHYHFGPGIVATPSDFGFQGIRPTHPQLLDWLARQLHANDWRMKPLHRLIVTSQTYRQSSRFEASMAASDADSLYLWRFPPRRLEAEAIRDAMLSVAGKLDLTMGGPGFRLFDYRVDNVAIYAPRDQFGPETYRRSVYHQNPRSVRVDLLGQFDCPDFSLPTPKRNVTVSPLQALALENHAFTLDMSRFLAERLEHDVPNGSPADRVRRGFLLAVARPPEPDEIDTCVRMITKHGLPAFCRAMFNLNEFIYVD